MELDHIAVVAADLDAGTAAVEAALGVTLAPGGRHARFGTWNRLLSLGPGLYLEVIAPDPEAPPPDRPRWFGLDAAPGIACIGTWVCRVPDLSAALAVAPDGAGEALDLARGDLTWRIAVPPDGRPPLGGAFPTLIEWGAGAHPSARLPEAGVRLVALEVRGPEADAAEAALGGRLDDPRVRFRPGRPGFRATFETPSGPRVLE